MNKRIILTSGLLLATVVSYGQFTDPFSQYSINAFRLSEQPVTGTARFQGIGGNHAAVGADASNAWGNPAGLAFFNRSEISISPSLQLNNVGTSYIGQTTNTQSTNPALSHFSLIFAGNPQSEGRALRRTALAITYSRQASLGTEYTFRGRNNRSSFVDQFIEDANDFNLTGNDLNGSFNDQFQEAAYRTAAAYQLYLINPSTEDASGVGLPPYFRYDDNVPIDQQVSFSSSGAQSQWNIAYAGNFNDKFYIGGSLAFTRSRFDYTYRYDEQYIGGRVFRSAGESNNYSSTGNGFNLSLGVMFKPIQSLQLGATVQSPTWVTLRETNDIRVFTDAIGIPRLDEQGQPGTLVLANQNIPIRPENFEGQDLPPTDYNVRTPLRASGGATYFFGRSGFLTATVEYVGYSSMRVSTGFYDTVDDNQFFRDDNRQAIQNTYQDAVNFRVGGEFRSGIFRVRAGAGYQSDPYKQSFDNIDRSRLLFSGGVGVRSDRFFADLAGVYSQAKSVYTPYVLFNRPTDYASAELTNRNTNLILSVGVFF